MTVFARLDFPVRPFPNTGESLAGYLFRLHNDNGHTITAELIKILKGLYSADSLDQLEVTFRELQSVLGPALVSVLDHDTWTYERFYLSVAPLWHQWNLATELRLRICPQCLAKYQYHLMLWELSHVTVCPVHRCRLLEHCSNCSRTLTWQTLRHDWTCLCGRALPEMSAPSVSGIRSAISAFLCNALDARRPPDYPIEHLSRIVGNRVELQYAYLRLHDLELLRAFIIRLSVDEYYSAWRTSYHARRYVKTPGRWTARLLYEWPAGFQRALLRLAKFHYRACVSTFVQIAPTTRELAVIDYLCAIEEYSWLDAPIRAATLNAIQSIKASFPFRSLVIYAPKLGKSERASRLNAFSRWWHSSYATWRRLDTSDVSLSVENFAYPASDVHREERIVHIINVMITAAIADLDTTQAHQLIKHWPLPQPLADDGDAEALIKTLVGQLAIVPSQRISDLESAVLQIEQTLAA